MSFRSKNGAYSVKVISYFSFYGVRLFKSSISATTARTNPTRPYSIVKASFLPPAIAFKAIFCFLLMG